jgi:hypothetical protein
LYIPPFWSHFVQYLDFAASFSVVSPSLVDWLFSRVYYLKLPFTQDTSADEKALVIVNHLANALVGLNGIELLESGTAGPQPGIASSLGSDVGDTWAERFVTLTRRSRFDLMEPYFADLYSEQYKASRNAEGSATKCWFKSELPDGIVSDILVDQAPVYEKLAGEFRDLLVVPNEKVKDALLSPKHVAGTEILLRYV